MGSPWWQVQGTEIWLRLSAPTLCKACTSQGRDCCPQLAHAELPVLLADGRPPPAANVLCPESLPSAGFGRVRAEHYAPEALGAGRWGPVSIEHVVGFCRELRERLEAGGGAAIFSSERSGMQANAALLVGAYLILELDLSADEACERLPPQALKRRFPQPWSESPRIHERSLTVRGCLQGLAVAKGRGWLRYGSFGECRWRSNLASYDASAVCEIPLRKHTRGGATLAVWALADPVTTVADPKLRPPPPKDGFLSDYSTLKGPRPRPRTFSCPCMDTVGVQDSEDSIRRVVSTSPAAASRPRSIKLSALAKHKGSWLFDTRLRHWSREQQAKQGRKSKISKQRTRATMPEFAGWLQARRCRALVRLNYGNEANLPPGGSYGEYFAQWCIPQRGFEFEDCTAPSDAVVRDFVEFMDQLCDEAELDPTEPGGSVMVHCTAGLGRTMTLLGAYAAHRLGVPGPAWLGWARMCRPGSVQTLGQEKFLAACGPTTSAGRALPGFSCLGRLLLRRGAPRPPAEAGQACQLQDGEAEHEEVKAASGPRSGSKEHSPLSAETASTQCGNNSSATSDEREQRIEI